MERCGSLLFAVVLGACATEPGLADTTRLGNTFDQVGPYVVRTVVTGTGEPDGLKLVYEIAAGEDVDQRAVEMVEVLEGERIYEGEIPGQPTFTQVRYHVELRDGDTTIADPSNLADGLRFGFWVLGAPCSAPVDCDLGETCHLPSQTCRAVGDSLCVHDRDCGKSRRCGSEGRCELSLRSCGECTISEVCSPTSAECVPRPTCEEGLSCPIDFLCEGPTKTCLRRCGGAGECNADEVCGAGFCRLP